MSLKHFKDTITKLSNPDMLHGPIFKSLVVFTVPIFASMLFQNLYSTVDSLIVGHVLGENSFAAVGAGGVVFELVLTFATGVGLGMSMVIARHFGNNNTEGVKRASAACLIVGLFLTALSSVLAFVFLNPLLKLLDTPEEIYADTYSYTSILILFVFTTFFYNLFCGMLKALGNSFVPLLCLIFTSLLNIVLDIAFVAVLGGGVSGAAWATVISQGLSALICGFYIWKKTPLLIPEKQHFRFDFKFYGDIAWSGISMGLMSAVVTIGTITLQYGINSLGTMTIAAHTAARKIYYLGSLPPYSLALSVSMYSSQNYGAGQYDRLRRALKSCYIFDALYSVGITVLFWSVARGAIAFVSGSQNDLVLTFGARYLCFSAPFYGLLGALGQVRFTLQGIGKKIIPIISSGIELAGKIVFTIALVPLFGYNAVIVCEPAVWVVMFIYLFISLYIQPEMKANGVKHL